MVNVRIQILSAARTAWNPLSLDMQLFPHIHAVLGPTDPLVVAYVLHLGVIHQNPGLRNVWSLQITSDYCSLGQN
jgi:hypothetical protein